MARFGKNKPSMQTGKTVVIEEGEGSLAGESFELPKTRDSFAAMIRFIKLILFSIIASLVIIAIALVIALLTVSAAIPTGKDGRILVLRNEYNQNSIPSGALMFLSSRKADDSLTGRFNQSVNGVAGPSIVKIVGGPNAPVETKNGEIYIDNKPTGIKKNVKNQYLDRTYIATCVEGACTPGEVVFAPQQNIIGTVKNRLDGLALSDYAPPTR